MHWINDIPEEDQLLSVRTRYRSKLVPLKSIKKNKNNTWSIKLKDDVRAVTSGQSAVIYNGEHVLGGGIVV